tara:strand:- start:10755 stop:11192 length:438 start_codon:yes stop_codon:yes gene_type:complete
MDNRKGATMLANYPNSLDRVNMIVATGALTTITKDGAPGTGVASRTGDKFMNGLKFIFDGRDNKQAGLNCVAYGDELVEQIEEFLKAKWDEGKPRPFGRLTVECVIQSNNYERNGVMQYQNELVIKNIWNAPKKTEGEFSYSEEE